MRTEEQEIRSLRAEIDALIDDLTPKASRFEKVDELLKKAKNISFNDFLAELNRARANTAVKFRVVDPYDKTAFLYVAKRSSHNDSSPLFISVSVRGEFVYIGHVTYSGVKRGNNGSGEERACRARDVLNVLFASRDTATYEAKLGWAP